jgi:hypothetical protein
MWERATNSTHHPNWRRPRFGIIVPIGGICAGLAQRKAHGWSFRLFKSK